MDDMIAITVARITENKLSWMDESKPSI